VGEHQIINELLIVLAVAGIVAPLFGRLRLGAIPGFLVAGALVGPGGLGGMVETYPWLDAVSFADPERVRPFAELGVVFLLFVVGLEVPLERLWAMRRLVLGLGAAQVLGSAIVIGVVAAWFGNRFGVAAALGLGLALSSTAIVTEMMIAQRRLAAPIGRAAISVLLFQDLMVVPIVIVIGLLAGEQLAVSWALAGAIVLSVLVVGLIVVLGRFLIRPVLRVAARSGSREAVVAIALLLAVGLALVTNSVGLSAALGAFLAGLVLAESEYRHQVQVDIEPFKGLLLGLFFMTVGMSFDPGLLRAGIWAILISVGGLLVLKAAIVGALGWGFRLGGAVSIELAFILAGAGEFAFVVLTLGNQLGLIAPAAHQFFVAITALSMLAIPVLGPLGRRLGAGIAQLDRGQSSGHGEEAAGFRDHVVIGGFGRVGRTVAEVLDAERIPYVALDLDADLVADQRARGHPVFFGDASHRHVLERVGGAEARAFVVTTDAAMAEERMVRAIRAAWPQATIHARAKDRAHARRLMDLGVASAIPEALEGSLQLAGRVLADEGLPPEVIDARLARQREGEVDRIGGKAVPPEGDDG